MSSTGLGFPPQGISGGSDISGTPVRGDVVVGNSTPEWERLAKGTALQALRMDSTATDVEWGSVASPFMFFRAESGIAHSANPAAFGASGNGSGYLAFDDSTKEAIVFLGAAHTALGAGDLTVTIHWYSASATTGDVVWNASFERYNTTRESDSFATAQAATTTVGGVVSIPTTTAITFTLAQADSIAAGEGFRLKLERDAANGSDDMTGDARVELVTVAQ